MGPWTFETVDADGVITQQPESGTMFMSSLDAYGRALLASHARVICRNAQGEVVLDSANGDFKDAEPEDSGPWPCPWCDGGADQTPGTVCGACNGSLVTTTKPPPYIDVERNDYLARDGYVPDPGYDEYRFERAPSQWPQDADDGEGRQIRDMSAVEEYDPQAMTTERAMRMEAEDREYERASRANPDNFGDGEESIDDIPF